MNREEFIKGYVVAFIGAWAGHKTASAPPEWYKTILKPPVEDAVFQAEESWKHCVKLCPEFFKEEKDV